MNTFILKLFFLLFVNCDFNRADFKNYNVLFLGTCAAGTFVLGAGFLWQYRSSKKLSCKKNKRLENENKPPFIAPRETTLKESLFFGGKSDSDKFFISKSLSIVQSPLPGNVLINPRNNQIDQNNKNAGEEEIILNNPISQEVAIKYENPVTKIAQNVMIQKQLTAFECEKNRWVMFLTKMLLLSSVHKNNQWYVLGRANFDQKDFLIQNVFNQKNNNKLFVPALYIDTTAKSRQLAFKKLIEQRGNKILEENALYFYRDVIARLNDKEKQYAYALVCILGKILENNKNVSASHEYACCLNTVADIKKMQQFKIYYVCAGTNDNIDDVDCVNVLEEGKKDSPKICRTLIFTVPREIFVSSIRKRQKLVAVSEFNYIFKLLEQERKNKHVQENTQQVLFSDQEIYVQNLQKTFVSKKLKNALFTDQNHGVFAFLPLGHNEDLTHNVIDIKQKNTTNSISSIGGKDNKIPLLVINGGIFDSARMLGFLKQVVRKLPK